MRGCGGGAAVALRREDKNTAEQEEGNKQADDQKQQLSLIWGRFPEKCEGGLGMEIHVSAMLDRELDAQHGESFADHRLTVVHYKLRCGRVFFPPRGEVSA